MSTTEIIHNLLSHRHTSFDNSFNKRGLYPVRDWLLGVFVFFSILIAGGVFSVYRFMQYVDISVDTQINDKKVTNYNKTAVDEVLKIYGAKKSEFIAIEQKSQEVPVVLVIVPDAATSVATTTFVASTTTSEGETLIDN